MPLRWWNNWSIPWYEQQIGGAFSALGSLARDVEGFFTDTSGQTPTPPPQPQRPGAPGLGDLSQILGLGGAAGGGGGGGGAAPFDGYTTPDGVQVRNGSPEDHYYKLADAVFTRLYGSHPDFAMARTFHDMGVENTDQLQQILLQMPSHIKSPDGTPITIGVYEDMLSNGNKSAQKFFGRPIPDSLIKDWVAQGITEPAAIENWFWSHPASDLPKDQYGAIWDAASQWTQKVWGAFKG
jgi:hypothetical protein